MCHAQGGSPGGLEAFPALACCRGAQHGNCAELLEQRCVVCVQSASHRLAIAELDYIAGTPTDLSVGRGDAQIASLMCSSEAEADDDVIPAGKDLLDFEPQVRERSEDHLQRTAHSLAASNWLRHDFRFADVGIVDALQVAVKITGIQSRKLLFRHADVLLF